MQRTSPLLASSALSLFGVIFALAGLAARPAWSQASVTTQHNNIGRTGANLAETILNTSNVTAGRFGELFTRTVDGEIYAEPLYLPHIAIPGKGTHNIVFVATEHNTVYAFDADSPTASTPLWQTNLGPSVPSSYYGDEDLHVETGITSTPVIDPATGTLYAVAATDENNVIYLRLHALDVTTGQEKTDSPVAVTGTVAGTGIASSGGLLSFDPSRHLQRPALLLSGGVVYFACASHADQDPYHGWIFGYNAATLQQTALYCTTANGTRGGIWQSGQGLAADSGGNLYTITGNGTFDASFGGMDFGDSFVKYSTAGGLAPSDWFTPSNQLMLEAQDLDLGSGPTLIPGTTDMVGGGKQGILYLVDTTDMGRFQSAGDNVVQEFQATTGRIFTSPIVWNSPNGQMLYLWGTGDTLKAYRLSGGQFQTTPASQSAMPVASGAGTVFDFAPALSLSANGSVAGTAIVWALCPAAGARPESFPIILRAFDATDLSHELWDSGANGIGNWSKFCPPLVAGGKVYVATFSNSLAVFGLLPPPSAPTNLTATAGIGQVALSWTASAGAVSYNLYRSTTAGGEGATPIKTGITATTCADTGLTGGTRYFYKVAAVNALGVSALSNEAEATPTANASVTLTPVADTYVQDGPAANTNFGTAPTLNVKYYPGLNRQTFLKFDLSHVTGNIAGATLRLYGGSAATGVSDTAYGVRSTTWTETGLTWNTRPALGSRLGSAAVTSTPQYVAWDVTGAAQKTNGSLSLAVVMDGIHAANPDVFQSREAGGNPPQLVLTLSNFPAGALSGSGALSLGGVNLTTAGMRDWAHWGGGDVPGLDRRAAGGALISDETGIGTGAVYAYNNDVHGFTWTDGAPTPSASNTTTGLYTLGNGNGFTFSVPAGTAPQTLRVYVGAYNAAARLTAHLSDGSAPDYTDASFTGTSGHSFDAVYTLTFHAASAGQTLAVTWTQTADNGNGTGNVNLQAAALP